MNKLPVIIVLLLVFAGLSIAGPALMQVTASPQEFVVIGELADQPGVAEEDQTTADELLQVIKRRIDPAGDKGFQVRVLDNGQLEFRFKNASVEEVEKIWSSLSTTGKLEFRIVADENQHLALLNTARKTAEERQAFVHGDEKDDNDKPKPIGQWVSLPREQTADDNNMQRLTSPFKFMPRQTHLLRDKQAGKIIEFDAGRFDGPQGRKRFADWCSDNGHDEIEILVAWPSNERQNVEGRFLSSVKRGFDDRRKPRMEFSFGAEGGKRMFSLTSRNTPVAGRYSLLGIVLDNQLVTAPRINEPIRNHGVIEGKLAQSEVDLMVTLLSSGELEIPLKQDWISIRKSDSDPDKK